LFPVGHRFHKKQLKNKLLLPTAPKVNGFGERTRRQPNWHTESTLTNQSFDMLAFAFKVQAIRKSASPDWRLITGLVLDHVDGEAISALDESVVVFSSAPMSVTQLRCGDQVIFWDHTWRLKEAKGKYAETSLPSHLSLHSIIVQKKCLAPNPEGRKYFSHTKGALIQSHIYRVLNWKIAGFAVYESQTEESPHYFSVVCRRSCSSFLGQS
jgi:hypothetical protein